jgi:hypothetical protein
MRATVQLECYTSSIAAIEQYSKLNGFVLFAVTDVLEQRIVCSGCCRLFTLSLGGKVSDPQPPRMG